MHVCTPAFLTAHNSACAKRDQIADLAHPRHRRGWWSCLSVTTGFGKGQTGLHARPNSGPVFSLEPRMRHGAGDIWERPDPPAQLLAGVAVRMLSIAADAVCADIRRTPVASGPKDTAIGLVATSDAAFRCRRPIKRRNQKEGQFVVIRNCVATCFGGKDNFHPFGCPGRNGVLQRTLWCDKLALTNFTYLQGALVNPAAKEASMWNETVARVTDRHHRNASAAKP